MREFHRFVYKEATLRIYTSELDAATAEVVRQRDLLDGYIGRHPDFRSSLVPVELAPGAPAIAQAMHRASRKTGIGPMAAVAGAVAQWVAEAALAAGATEAIVENGGDLFLLAREPVTVALVAGEGPPRAGPSAVAGPGLAFRVAAAQMPVAICSSSSNMGHSLSFGDCDLATVVAADAALADAAATLACNRVRAVSDIQPTLDEVGAIDGVRGLLIVKDGSIGLIGDLPELVRNVDSGTAEKITRFVP